MSWSFWSKFLKSKDDYYPVNDADIFAKEHSDEAKIIESILDNPEKTKGIEEE